MQKESRLANTKDLKVNQDHESRFLHYINRNGIAYERMLLEQHFPRVKSILQGKNPPPYELEIQPYSRCNANCDHCWAKCLKKLEDKLDNKSAMEKVIRESLEFRMGKFEINTIKFCGSTGETLLNPQVFNAINLIYTKREIRLFTNGLLLAANKKNYKYLKVLSKVSRLNESLDAANTSTLHKIKKGSKNVVLEDILIASKKIKQIAENDLIVEASYVITNNNYREIAEFAKKVSDFEAADAIRYRIDLTDRTVSRDHGNEIFEGIQEAKKYERIGLKIIPIHSEDEIKEEEEGYFNSRESGLKCFTSRIWACLGANGYLFPCGHIVSGDSENYGSVLEHGLSETWNSQQRGDLISRLPTDKCTICSPFSLRINRFLSEISQWPIEEVDFLQRKYIENGN